MVPIEVIMVPMPVSHANANANVADLNSDVFRDDHWFVAGTQRARTAPLGAEQQKG